MRSHVMRSRLALKSALEASEIQRQNEADAGARANDEIASLKQKNATLEKAFDVLRKHSADSSARVNTDIPSL